jgi:hypothetical protein
METLTNTVETTAIKTIIAQQRAYFNSGATKSVKFRKEKLILLKNLVIIIVPAAKFYEKGCYAIRLRP